MRISYSGRIIVAYAVYFHRGDQSQLDELCNQKEYVELLTPDSLTQENFKRILRRTWLSKTSRYFDDDLYKSFHRYLQTPWLTYQWAIVDHIEDALFWSVCSREVPIPEEGDGPGWDTSRVVTNCMNAMLLPEARNVELRVSWAAAARTALGTVVR